MSDTLKKDHPMATEPLSDSTASVPEIDFLEYLRRLWRHKIGMGIITTVMVAASVIWTTRFAEKRYVSRATILPIVRDMAPFDALTQALPSGGLLRSIGLQGGTDTARRLIVIAQSQALRYAIAKDLELLAWFVEPDWQDLLAREGPIDPNDTGSIVVALIHTYPNVMRDKDPEDPDQGILSMSDDALRERIGAIEQIEGAPGDDVLEEIRVAWYRRVRALFDGLREGIRARVDQNDLITIEVEMPRDAAMASLVANRLLTKLDEYVRSTTLTESRRKREFIEQRFNEVRDALAAAEEAEAEFKRRHRLISISQQANEMISQLAEVEGELEAKKLMRDVLLDVGVARTNPRIQSLNYEIQGLERRLNEFEGGGDNLLTSTGVREIPDLERQYAKLLREKTVQETLFSLLAQQYELAKIDEIRDQDTFQTLDPAEPPPRPSRPRLVANVISATIIGGLLAVFYASFLEYRIRRRPLP